jgi:predicted nucleotidyltransferase
MQTPIGSLDDKQCDCVRRVLAAHPVELAYLYGSSAIGQASVLSDLDIALVVAEGAFDPSQRLRFELAIEDELAEGCGLHQADVRVVNDAPLALRGQVVTFGRLLYENDPASRIEFESRTRMEYFDFIPILDALRQTFFADIARRGLHDQRAKSRRSTHQSEPIFDLSP